jgi:hypothetical protein
VADERQNKSQKPDAIGSQKIREENVKINQLKSMSAFVTPLKTGSSRFLVT